MKLRTLAFNCASNGKTGPFDEFSPAVESLMEYVSISLA